MSENKNGGRRHLTVTLDPHIVELVEDYWHDQRLASRSAAVEAVLRLGLRVSEELAA